MTKEDLVKEISSKTKITSKQTIVMLEAFMDVAKESMMKGKNIYLRGFGTFQLYKRNAKPGRVISRNEPIMIPAHYICKFKPCKEFAGKLRNAIPVK